MKLNDNREFKGRVIGTDPSTDLALVKIESEMISLLFRSEIRSVESRRVGIAVGNPFNLNSTVQPVS